jgi:hypothetical protein
MNKDYEKRRTILLGEPFSTACTKLRKIILFNLLIKYHENICFRCNKIIENIEDLSIEHKESWINSTNPKEKFYDLKNIAFSHLHCNHLNTSSLWKKGWKQKSKL